MALLTVANGIDDDWKEDMSHSDCARFFFNESHQVTKERFFRVCCRTWMAETFVSNYDTMNNVSYTVLWKTLQQVYLSSRSREDDTNIISCIVPDLSPAVFSDSNFRDTQDVVGNDEHYRECLMAFWRELFKASEIETSASQNHESSNESRRGTKRRRLGPGRFASLGFKNLLKGRYKLPAIYLMISLLNETGQATDWPKLCDFAHQLPTIFKTFSENDILAGLALVGLDNMSTGRLLEGVTPCALIRDYFSGIDSYGPSIFRILHDVTGLNFYNLRALICWQIVNYLNINEEWSEEMKFLILDACAACINQVHPGRYLCDLENKQQAVCGKRRQRMNKRRSKPCIPDQFSSPAFPLLVHIQVCLLRHEAERAAQITRKMDSSPILNAEAIDEAWFRIWTYLLDEGILFLDGNLDTPGYLQKRDFLYKYMACQVSQRAKTAMMDFYGEVANRIYEQEDSSLEEKNYVILACQQTVLRLLLKIRGLGINTTNEFIQETKWKIDLPGQKSEVDLDEWCAKFLLLKREVPSSLVDKKTGLIDLMKRFEDVREKASEEQIESAFLAAESGSPSRPIESSMEENKPHGFESSRLGDLNKPLSALEGLQQHETGEIDHSRLSNAFQEGIEVDENNEVDEDDGVLLVNEGDDPEEMLVVDGDDSNEVVEIDDDEDDDDREDGNHISYDDYSIHNESSEKENLKYSDNDEDSANDIDGTAILDEENSDSDVSREYSEGEGEGEGEGEDEDEDDGNFIDVDAGEAEWIQESDGGIDDLHQHSEDESGSRVEDYPRASDDGYTALRKDESDECDVDEESDDSDCIEVDAKDGEDDEPVHNDVSTDLNPKVQDGGGLSAPFAAANTESKVAANDQDDTASDKNHIPKAHNFRAGGASAGREFGDTTEEEDGNDRFKANNIAQADRLADVLRSGVGYASQVEDGYEPEDTHGYTEEEVSEAIHTEDEEDENTAKQKAAYSDTDTSQHRVGDVSHSNNAGVLVAGQPPDTVGNLNRQNSIEPTSDDMDMADEHTEQEEDNAAESELEENPSESRQPIQATTLLEFAQKAQNEEPAAKQTDSNRNDAQRVLQTVTEGGLLAQKPELSKTCASSFDADDEKYATEGCKSLETEEEEDTEKDGVDSMPREGPATVDDNMADGVCESRGKGSEVGPDESEVGIHEDALSDIQGKTLAEGQSIDEDRDSAGHEDIDISFHAKGTVAVGDEVSGGTVRVENIPNDTETLNDGAMEAQHGEIESEVRQTENEFTEKDIGKHSDAGDCSMGEDVADEIRVNKLAGGHAEPPSAVDSTDVASQIEDDIDKEIPSLGIQERDDESEPTPNQLNAPKRVDNGKEKDVIASENVGETANDDWATSAGDMKVDEGGSAAIDDFCAEDKTGDPSSAVVNPLSQVADDDVSHSATVEKAKNDDDGVNDGITGEKGHGDTTNADDRSDLNYPGHHDTGMTEDHRVLAVQGNSIIDASATIGAKSIFEETDSKPIKNYNAKAAQDETKETKPTMDVENDLNSNAGSSGGLEDKETAPLGPNQPEIQLDEAQETKDVSKDTGFSPSDEILEKNDSVEDESSDIPRYIGGDTEQRSSGPTTVSEKPADLAGGSDEEERSNGDEVEDNGDGASVISGASAISEIFRTHGQESESKEDEMARNAKPDVSVEEKEKPSTRASTRASKGKIRGGLPPRPPGPSRRTTRSKKIMDDGLSAHKNSTRSTRSSSRKQKVKNDDDGDDASVQTITSTRSTRSSTRKISAGTRASRRKAVEEEADDASVQTITSTRSTRSSTRKASIGTRASKRKAVEEVDDDASVQTVTSTRSTRSSTRKKPSTATKDITKGANDKADQYSTWTVKKLQEELKRREIQFPSKARKKVLQDLLASSDEEKKSTSADPQFQFSDT